MVTSLDCSAVVDRNGPGAINDAVGAFVSRVFSWANGCERGAQSGGADGAIATVMVRQEADVALNVETTEGAPSGDEMAAAVRRAVCDGSLACDPLRLLDACCSATFVGTGGAVLGAAASSGTDRNATSGTDGTQYGARRLPEIISPSKVVEGRRLSEIISPPSGTAALVVLQQQSPPTSFRALTSAASASAVASALEASGGVTVGEVALRVLSSTIEMTVPASDDVEGAAAAVLEQLGNTTALLASLTSALNVSEGALTVTAAQIVMASPPPPAPTYTAAAAQSSGDEAGSTSWFVTLALVGGCLALLGVLVARRWLHGAGGSGRAKRGRIAFMRSGPRALSSSQPPTWDTGLTKSGPTKSGLAEWTSDRNGGTPPAQRSRQFDPSSPAPPVTMVSSRVPPFSPRTPWPGSASSELPEEDLRPNDPIPLDSHRYNAAEEGTDLLMSSLRSPIDLPMISSCSPHISPCSPHNPPMISPCSPRALPVISPCPPRDLPMPSPWSPPHISL